MNEPAIPPIHVQSSEPVRVDGDLVRVNDACIADACAAALITRGEKGGTRPIRTLARIVETGARVIEQAGTHVQVDYVREAFQAVAGEVTQRLADGAAHASAQLTGELSRLFDPERGDLALVLARHAGGLERTIAESFGEDSARAVHLRISAGVTEALERSRRALLAHLSSEDGGINPLADFKQAVARIIEDSGRRQEKAAAEMREGLTKVRTGLAELAGRQRAEEAAEATLASERARGAAKGFSHEDRVHALLAQIASAHGDIAHDVSDLPSPGGRKTGDTLIEIDAAAGPPEGRIVVEAKDERLSWARAASELDRAISEREADYAILVVSDENRLPAGCASLQEYLGNKLIVALTGSEIDEELLRLAYRYARVRIRLLRGGVARVDAPAVREAAQAALLSLRGARAIQSALTGASRQIESARAGLGALCEAVSGQLSRIEDLVRPADDELKAA
jgi:hypothetical protein